MFNNGDANHDYHDDDHGDHHDVDDNGNDDDSGDDDLLFGNLHKDLSHFHRTIGYCL